MDPQGAILDQQLAELKGELNRLETERKDREQLVFQAEKRLEQQQQQQNTLQTKIQSEKKAVESLQNNLTTLSLKVSQAEQDGIRLAQEHAALQSQKNKVTPTHFLSKKFRRKKALTEPTKKFSVRERNIRKEIRSSQTQHCTRNILPITTQAYPCDTQYA